MAGWSVIRLTAEMKLTFLQKIGNFAQYILIQIVISLFQAFPLEMCDRICRSLASLISDRIGFRRKIIRENILGVFPEASDEKIATMSREMWYHLLLMGVEIAQAPRKIHDTNWRKHVYIRDIVQMTNYLIDYRPLVAVSGHFGNFEMGGYVLSLIHI